MPFNHFDFLAPWYEKVNGRGEPRDWTPILEYTGAGRLLDAGGGTGRMSKQLCRSHSFRQAVIADESWGMLKQARQAGLDAVLCHSEHLPFRSAAFDRVIMVDALHHVAEQRKTVVEMHRMLAHEGVVIIEEPDIEAVVIKVLAVLEKLALMRSHFLSVENIKKLLPAGVRHDVIRAGSTFWFRIFAD